MLASWIVQYQTPQGVLLLLPWLIPLEQACQAAVQSAGKYTDSNLFFLLIPFGFFGRFFGR